MTKDLLNYMGISVREILARYRNQFPEFVDCASDSNLREEIDRFERRLKVNIEFFEVSSVETERYICFCPFTRILPI